MIMIVIVIIKIILYVFCITTYLILFWFIKRIMMLIVIIIVKIKLWVFHFILLHSFLYLFYFMFYFSLFYREYLIWFDLISDTKHSLTVFLLVRSFYAHHKLNKYIKSIKKKMSLLRALHGAWATHIHQFSAFFKHLGRMTFQYLGDDVIL